jgi:hypothetical protein
MAWEWWKKLWGGAGSVATGGAEHVASATVGAVVGAALLEFIRQLKDRGVEVAVQTAAEVVAEQAKWQRKTDEVRDELFAYLVRHNMRNMLRRLEALQRSLRGDNHVMVRLVHLYVSLTEDEEDRLEVFRALEYMSDEEFLCVIEILTHDVVAQWARRIARFLRDWNHTAAEAINDHADRLERFQFRPSPIPFVGWVVDAYRIIRRRRARRPIVVEVEDPIEVIGVYRD